MKKQMLSPKEYHAPAAAVLQIAPSRLVCQSGSSNEDVQPGEEIDWAPASGTFDSSILF